MNAMPTLPKVLFVDDDRYIADALSQALQNSYDLDIAGTGKLALYKTDIERYDIIILDLHLPDLPGLDVCRQLRERGVHTPILILSGENKILTKINLLDAGANDYLTKPFSLGELKARLRALGRQPRQSSQPIGRLVVADLSLDRQAFKVSRAGAEIDLRRKEFAVLECLMEHAGTVVTREALARYVWHGNEALWTNTVDVHIKHLRDKIDRPFGRTLIRTVHGLGYMLEAEAPALVRKD
jgi:two-component system, OmpR family, response regulator